MASAQKLILRVGVPDLVRAASARRREHRPDVAHLLGVLRARPEMDDDASASGGAAGVKDKGRGLSGSARVGREEPRASPRH